MMKVLKDLCIKILLFNRMSSVSMLHYRDRSVPSSEVNVMFYLVETFISVSVQRPVAIGAVEVEMGAI